MTLNILFISFFVGLSMLILFSYIPDDFGYQPSKYSPINATNMSFPQFSLTPGDVLTTDKEIVCVTGYSSTVRDVPQSLREKVFAAYNVPYPQPKGSTEVDHAVPLCAGGSNDEKNLWVQFDTYPGYHEKDRVEIYLCKQVCDGKMSLQEAQEKIRTNWLEVYNTLP